MSSLEPERVVQTDRLALAGRARFQPPTGAPLVAPTLCRDARKAHRCRPAVFARPTGAFGVLVVGSDTPSQCLMCAWRSVDQAQGAVRLAEYPYRFDDHFLWPRAVVHNTLASGASALRSQRPMEEWARRQSISTLHISLTFLDHKAAGRFTLGFRSLLRSYRGARLQRRVSIYPIRVDPGSRNGSGPRRRSSPDARRERSDQSMA
jgi:hypothetical protein